MATLNKSNRKSNYTVTHEGGHAIKVSPTKMLERSVCACLLWEDSFYESGEEIANRISKLVAEVPVKDVIRIAEKAKFEQYLRHVPLKLGVDLLKRSKDASKVGVNLADVLDKLIVRADELTEVLSIYWKDQKDAPLSAQLKKGLARAFTKFDEYQLAKYNRSKEIKLRDVMRLVHPVPKDAKQEAIFKRLLTDELATPDTWEVAISATKGDAKAKSTEWRRLLEEKKINGLSLIRNLRNLEQANVPEGMIIEAIHAANLKRINPFQIFAAIKHCGNKNVAKALDSAFIRATENLPKLSGTTVALIDVSGSMTFDTVSKRSEMTRMEAAASLGAILREVCDKLRLIPFATAHGELVTKVRGGTLVQAIVEAGRRMGGGTNTGDAVHFANQMDYDRIIIVTDEQSHQRIEQPQGNGYIVNVGSYEPSIAYGDWTSITGWSENFITYISESEKD